jgi:bacterioferritin-associated ferredoxin
MYVCVCNAVSDRQVRAAVAGGARSLEDLSLALGVGAGCGCCRDAAQEYIQAAGHCGGDCVGCARIAASG